LLNFLGEFIPCRALKSSCEPTRPFFRVFVCQNGRHGLVGPSVFAILQPDPAVRRGRGRPPDKNRQPTPTLKMIGGGDQRARFENVTAPLGQSARRDHRKCVTISSTVPSPATRPRSKKTALVARDPANSTSWVTSSLA